MKCENCGKDHDGSYGSGRFCSVKCAKGFATKNKREEINKKVSKSLTGRESWIPSENKYCHKFTPEQRKKGGLKTAEINRQKILEKYNNGEYLRSETVRPILLKEQNNKCAICSMEPVWNGESITFDVDHIDGDSSNYSPDNLRAICPNCHRQTETFGGKNAGKGHSREYLKKYLSYDERRKILSEKRIFEINDI